MEHNYCLDDSSDVTICNNHPNLGYNSSLIKSDGSCSEIYKFSGKILA